jgi:hypothetical protein
MDIDAVLAELDRVVERAIADGDACGYFAVLYRKVTAKVKEGLAAGFFDDAARMERLDTIFAQRYLDAIEARDAGSTPTASWQLTFQAGRRWRPLILQHLLVGINAHINLDLGIAAARCSPGDELADLRRDYDRINAILASMIAALQRDLVRMSPWLGLLDRFGARSQQELVRFSIVLARAGAWRFATQLAAAPEDGWPALIDERDQRVAHVGDRVLHPGVWMSSGLVLVRLRERGDVTANLRLLMEAEEPSLDDVEVAVDEPTLEP